MPNDNGSPDVCFLLSRCRKLAGAVRRCASRASALSLVAGLAAAMVGGAAHATDPLDYPGEVLYLIDSHFHHAPGSPYPDDVGVCIWRAFIDPTSSPPVANLAHIVITPEFHEVDAAGTTPDGSKIYLINKEPDPKAGELDSQGNPLPDFGGRFGYFDVTTQTVTVFPYLVHDSSDTVVPGIVLAAFSPDGTLYVASQDTEKLYTVNTSTGLATPVGADGDILVGGQMGPILDLTGADLAFTASGDLYLWTNAYDSTVYSVTPQVGGLYQVFLPPDDSTDATATSIGAANDEFFTGLAVRANGLGDLAGSDTDDNEIHVQSKSPPAQDVPPSPYDMVLNHGDYDYTFGDMANGPLGDLCTATIGFYKNHDWMNGVTLCGLSEDTSVVPIDQATGQGILWGATGKDFSMLFAQLIAAKLNSGNGDGVQVVEDAEQWLCEQSNAYDGTDIYPHASFTSTAQKATATNYESQLDAFNNGLVPGTHHCD
jgi:hypothetical protein